MNPRAKRLTSVAFLFLFQALTWAAQAADYQPSPELKALSKLLQNFQSRLEEYNGTNVIYVGGGSSRAILDHIYFKKKLEMRDLDVFMVANTTVDEAYGIALGQALENAELGKFAREDLRPRPRYDETLPFPHEFNAGYGFFWINNEGRIFDLSMFHSEYALKQNGVFTIDRVMVPITKAQTLEALAMKLAKIQPTQASNSGLIRDVHQGYTDWINKKPVLLDKVGFLKDPALTTLRSIRTFNKLQVSTLPKDFVTFVQGALKNAKPTNRLQMGRNFLKLLEDEAAAKEIKTLTQAGILSAWSAELDALFTRLKEKDLARILKIQRVTHQPRGPPKALGNYFEILDALSKSEKLSLLADIATVEEPAVSSEYLKEIKRWDVTHLSQGWLSQGFSKNCVQSPQCLKALTRALSSDVLSKEERANLIIRAQLLTPAGVSDPKGLFDQLTEGALGTYEAFEKKWMKPRTGYYSGVFNPMHLGHLQAAQLAVNDMALDNLYVIPTPATGHNETPLPWEIRMEMANAAVQGIDGLTVIPADYEAALRESTGKALEKLMASAPNNHWFHVMGSDSLERFLQRFGATRNQAITVYAITRGEITPELKALMAAHPGVVIGKSISKASIGQGEQERSSSVVRKLLQQGKSISGLVSPAVEKIILEKGLYQTPKEGTGPCDALFTEAPLH